ncbi:hypothetical protein [Latilactobacillus sakei]|nr:hypothetical protein [Latilactobacillus sakei]QVQ49083.1 hypothetical protein KIK01_00735 [Latilactobacillus sakei subsp. sakei]
MTLADKIELINDAHKRAKQSHNYNAAAYYEAQLVGSPSKERMVFRL